MNNKQKTNFFKKSTRGMPGSELFWKKSSTTGFSLIELLVCLTILSIVIVIGMGLLLATNASVGASRAQRRSMDNLNFAIETMSRSITYGSSFACISGGSPNNPASCDVTAGGSTVISFQGYYLSSSSLGTIEYERKEKQINGKIIGYIARTAGGSTVSLTDDRVDIQELRFYVYHALPFGTGTGYDPEQPRVTAVIRGVSKASGTDQEFFIQTTLSQRDLKL